MLTFIDASVLNAAFRVQGGLDVQRRAFSVLSDPERIFIASFFLVMEVMPVVTCFKHPARDFYQIFFDAVVKENWVAPEPLLEPAHELACRYGLGAMDALHLTAAASRNAEFVSAERPGKPMFRAYAKAVSIRDAEPTN
jgi:hypothetical protein